MCEHKTDQICSICTPYSTEKTCVHSTPRECFNTIFSQQVFFQNIVMLFPSRSIKPTQKPLVCKNIQTASITFSANKYSFKIQRCCSPPDQVSLHRNHSSVKIFNIQTASIPFSANKYSFKIQRCCSPPDQLSLHRNHLSVKIFSIQTASIPFSANKYSLKIQSCCSPPDHISLHRNHS